MALVIVGAPRERGSLKRLISSVLQIPNAAARGKMRTPCTSIGHQRMVSRLSGSAPTLQEVRDEPVSSSASGTVRSVHHSPAATPVPTKRYLDEDYDEGCH